MATPRDPGPDLRFLGGAAGPLPVGALPTVAVPLIGGALLLDCVSDAGIGATARIDAEVVGEVFTTVGPPNEAALRTDVAAEPLKSGC